MGGGTDEPQQRDNTGKGLSPRGRGNRPPPTRDDGHYGSIPAWAGEPESRLTLLRCQGVYPRVGGGTANWRAIHLRRAGLSPRGRGNRDVEVRAFLEGGSIPAWAGEPSGDRCTAATRRVYPRVGGGTRARALVIVAAKGLSPRGRGNHWGGSRANGWAGSIPAWAGEPLPINSMILFTCQRAFACIQFNDFIVLRLKGHRNQTEGKRDSCYFLLRNRDFSFTTATAIWNQ